MTKAKPKQIAEIKQKQVGKVKFKSKQTQLKYSLTALSKIEQQGINVTEMEGNEQSVTEIITFLWAGLLWKYPDLTIEEAGAEFDMTDIVTVASAISIAFNASVKI